MEPLSLAVLAGAIGVSGVINSKKDVILSSLEKTMGDLITKSSRLDASDSDKTTIIVEMDLDKE